MGGHLRTFSLVDRITQLEPGKRAEGRFSVPAHVSRFSSCLAAEAAGQLAAWVAMAELDFEVRPVAGVAADMHFGTAVQPGQTLDLAIEIDDCDKEAVTYSARASAEGVRVVELERSAGPMLPMESFDAPDAMRSRYELLCGPGVPAGQFPGVPEHDIEFIEVRPDRARDAQSAPRSRLSSPTTFRGVRCFPAPCCWMRTFSWRSLQASARVTGLPARASKRRGCRI